MIKVIILSALAVFLVNLLKIAFYFIIDIDSFHQPL